jgi:hypothetical protein
LAQFLLDRHIFFYFFFLSNPFYRICTGLHARCRQLLFTPPPHTHTRKGKKCPHSVANSRHRINLKMGLFIQSVISPPS